MVPMHTKGAREYVRELITETSLKETEMRRHLTVEGKGEKITGKNGAQQRELQYCEHYMFNGIYQKKIS